MRTHNGDPLVSVGSAQHPDMFKTLVLLKITGPEEPVYFIVEGCAQFEDLAEVNDHNTYFYEEHTCPTNFIRIEAVFTPEDDDPHGTFEHVATVWLTESYVAAKNAGEQDEWLRRAFPQSRLK